MIILCYINSNLSKSRKRKKSIFFFFCRSIQFWVCIQINRQKMTKTNTQNKQTKSELLIEVCVCACATGTNSQMTSFFKWCCVFLYVCLCCVVCVVTNKIHSKPHYKINQFFRIFCLDIDLLCSIRNVVNIQKKTSKYDNQLILPIRRA